MSKIGRNEPCPCGSGKKYKKCCLPLQQDGRAGIARHDTLIRTVSALQAAAAVRKETFRTLGVFILFSTVQGDAWLLEATEMDAVQAASGGKAITVEIEEGPGTIAVNWTHRFVVQHDHLALTAYADQCESRLPSCPLQQIKAAINAIRSHASPSVHLDAPIEPPQLTPSH